MYDGKKEKILVTSIVYFFHFLYPHIDRLGHIVFGSSFVCLFVCLQKLTLAIAFEWYVMELSYFLYLFLGV